MKKLVLVLLLVALLLSFTLSVAFAGMGMEDPQNPGQCKKGDDAHWVKGVPSHVADKWDAKCQ